MAVTIHMMICNPLPSLKSCRISPKKILSLDTMLLEMVLSNLFLYSLGFGNIIWKFGKRTYSRQPGRDYLRELGETRQKMICFICSLAQGISYLFIF